ncbi:SGNH/GDSL hydrolase family protein [Myxococcota bacterium]|nr:SGNH/GDSL hydrolase family protein [Myxococcota bacterium]
MLILFLFGLGLVVWVAIRMAPAFDQSHLARLNDFHSSLAADRGKGVVCLGDSLTHGNVSYDYVHALASRLEPNGYTVLNAGLNGDLAWNVLQRIDAVLQGTPSFVVLLVGTNDARACESEWAAKRYVKRKKLPQLPDPDFFMTHYETILDTLEASGNTQVVLVTLPPLGERAGEPIDAQVEQFNRFILDQAEKRGLFCVDLNASLVDLIEEVGNPEAPAYDARVSERWVGRSVFLHYVLGWNWSRIAKRFGMYFSPDMIHLTQAGAAPLIEQVDRALRDLQSKAQSSGPMPGG